MYTNLSARSLRSLAVYTCDCFIVLYNFNSFCYVELNDKTKVNKWLVKVRKKSITSQFETWTRNLSGATEGNLVISRRAESVSRTGHEFRTFRIRSRSSTNCIQIFCSTIYFMDSKYQILSKSLGVVVKHGHAKQPDPTAILGVYVKFMLNVC